MRLNKYLAAVGLASRRGADSLIKAGKVTLNGKMAVLGDQVDPQKDQIILNNQPIGQIEKKYYLVINKPVGVVSTVHDEQLRPSVISLVPKIARLYPVGRLDLMSEGLLILTNDGDFALKLTHPRYHLPKEYLVTVRGQVDLSRLNDNHQQVKIVSRHPNSIDLQFILFEGRNRQIRHLCRDNNLTILQLKRVRIGSLTLGNLHSGQWRYLTPPEVSSLFHFSSVTPRQAFSSTNR